jgi:glycine cleavage system H protein
MSLSALSSRLFPTMRSQAMARFAAPGSSFARFYASTCLTFFLPFTSSLF